MPPQLLFDISEVDLNRVIFSQEEIRKTNPQRGDMEHLNGIVYLDEPLGRMIGFKEVKADEFWVPGHIPGRPLLPGVLMIEAAAQLAAFYSARFTTLTGFIGFGGLNECRFRAEVRPPCRLYILIQRLEQRHRRVKCRAQGLVDGQLVFEADIIGTQM
jgi:3-hydroxyacyl-[acyl-carrier-protein] dehydratase